VLERNKIIQLSVFILLWMTGYGQELRFTHIDSKDGLPNSLVFAIEQDRNGFIWFGTNKGLARYDGYNFRVFLPDEQKKFSISNKSVFRLKFDHNDYLWLCVQGRGLNKMDPRTERFAYYFPDPTDPYSISGNDVRQIYEHPDNSIWIASNKGIDLYDSINDRFNRLFDPQKYTDKTIPSNFVEQIEGDNNQNIWFITRRGIGSYNRIDKTIKTIGEITHNPYLDTMTMYSIKVIADKDLLFFSTGFNGLYSYNIVSGELNNYFSNYRNLRSLYLDKNENLFMYANKPLNTIIIAPKLIFDEKKIIKYPVFDGPGNFAPLRIAENRMGEVYFACTQGIVGYNPVKGFSPFRSDINDPRTLKGSNIETVFVDNKDNFWISIFRMGIDKADLQQKSFNWYISNPSIPNQSIIGNNIISIFEDRSGKVWVGCTDEGITRIDLKNKIYTNIPIKISDPAKINFNAPATFFEDDQGFIWVGYYDGQLDKINPITLKINHYLENLPASNPFKFDAWNLRKILADKQKNLWFVTSMGIVELNIKTQQFIYHSLYYEEDYSQNYLYRTMYIGNDGLIWAGSQNGGLIRYDTTAKKFTHFLNKPNDQNSISSNLVYAIYEENNDTLWIGTSSGLNIFEKKTNKFTRILTKEGLDKYAIYCIFPDKEDNFWMSSDYGIIKFNKSTYSYTNYYQSDGLPGNEFNTTAHCLTKSGEIFLGTPKGMISFRPENIKPNPYSAHPIITDLKIFNKSIAPGDSLFGRVVLKQQIWATKKLELLYKENDFILEFSALHYSAPEKIKYYYILEGFNNDWVYTTSDRRWAVFTGLQPGEYTFKLKATNNDGIICRPEDEVSLDIIILPPFWGTLWFRFLTIVALITLFLLYLKWRIDSIKSQKMLLEVKVKERTIELEEANVVLEEKQEEINLQKEEIQAQRDTLEEKNKLLTNQHEHIVKQNKELDIHRNKLESLVIERTSELEKALYKAEESDRLKSSFLANMSHEIRTPMNAIIGFSNLLREKDIDDNTKDNFISTIINNGELLLVLINDILDLSKIQADQMTLSPLFINLLPILNEVHRNFSIETSKKGIDLKLGGLEIKDNFIIGADRTRLIQVLSNLISNSIKFTKKGSVEFGVCKINKDITFYVSDTGVGIPENIGNTIFERFLKLEDNKDAIFSGTGLGLAICKSLVELWGGKIWYESVPSVKTTFYFTHPISIGTRLKEQPTRLIKTTNIPNWSGVHILIAEDEENNFKMLKKFLAPSQAKISWAKDGEEAVKIALQQKVDLILMDIKLPVLDGMDATRQIKTIKPDLPIIAQTAFAYDNEIKNFLEAGVDAYLIKPIILKELILLLKNYIKA
jgi:signal transduction histidine kinase/ligand-binding sensor domain-containing protein/CheY-like chemotaxis protein